MNNNNVVVPLSENKDKPECFAWISKDRCNALSTKKCKNCNFYRHKSEISNYNKYLSKNDLIERKKNRCT